MFPVHVFRTSAKPLRVAAVVLAFLLIAGGCNSPQTEEFSPVPHDGVAQGIPEMPSGAPPEPAPPPPPDDTKNSPVTPPATSPEQEAPVAEAAKEAEAAQAVQESTVKAPVPAPGPAAGKPAIADPRLDHGQSPVLRSRTRLKEGEKKRYPLVTPDWNKPYELTFNKLVGNYRYYQVHGAFFEQGLPRIHGGAVTLSGAVMPIDPPGDDGKLSRFWLANPLVVMAGCVFCVPPSLGDLVYVEANPPLVVDREELYKSVVTAKLLGRLFIDGGRQPDGLEYLYRLQLKKVVR